MRGVTNTAVICLTLLCLSVSSWAIIPGEQHELPPCPPSPTAHGAVVESYELGTIGRALHDGPSLVTLNDKVVTASQADTGGDFFYIEEEDRSAGIRVNSAIAVAKGNTVSITNGRTSSLAQTTAMGGERYVYLDSADNPSVVLHDRIVNLAPLGMENMCVGGSTSESIIGEDSPHVQGITGGCNPILGFDFGRGPYNKGLLIRVWGVVRSTHVDVQNNEYWFYIDDGAHFDDCTGSGPGIRVRARWDTVMPFVGQYVFVTGVSASFYTESGCIPLVVPRDNADFVTLMNDGDNSNDADGISTVASPSDVIVAPPPGVSSNWNLVSLPTVPYWNSLQLPAADYVFDATRPACENGDLHLSLWRWVPSIEQCCLPEASSSYQTYYEYDPDQSLFGPSYTGVGYWVKAVEGADPNDCKIQYVGVGGLTQTTDRYVMLCPSAATLVAEYAGSAAIGYPFGQAQPLSNVQVTDGYRILSIADAMTSNWIQQRVSTWDNTDANPAYAQVLLSGGEGVETNLRPWHGYWIRALKPHLALIIPCPKPEDTASLTCEVTSPRDSTNVSPIPFTIKFSKLVRSFSASSVTLTNGTASGLSGGGDTYTILVTPNGQGPVTCQVPAGVAMDAAGNLSDMSNTASVTYDCQRPTCSVSGPTEPTNSSAIEFTVTFSKSVTSFDLNKLDVTGGSVISLSGSGDAYTVTVNATYPSDVTCTAQAGTARDVAGNDSTASNTYHVTYDTDRPRASIGRAANQPDLTNASTINFTARFDEPVTDLTSDDVTIAGTAGGNLSAVVTPDGTDYNIAVSGMASSGTVEVSIGEDTVHDRAGNGCLPSVNSDTPVTFDNHAPQVAFSSPSKWSSNSGPVSYTLTFDEAVTGFDSDTDLQVISTGGATAGTVTVSGSGPTSYTITLSNLSGNGTLGIKVKADACTDLAGNTFAQDSSSRSFAVDNQPLTVTVEKSSSQDSPTNALPIAFDIHFNKMVWGFSNSDVVVQGAANGQSVVDIAGSNGQDFNIVVGGLIADSTITVSVPGGAVTDAAGNANSASTQNPSVQFDKTRPTVTVSCDGSPPYYTNASPIRFNVEFRESVTGFTSDDVVLGGNAGGPLAKSISGSGENYTIQVTGMTTTGDVTVDIPANAAIDDAENGNTVSNRATVRFDNSPPHVQSIGVPSPSATKSGPVVFPITFDEEVVGFDSPGDVQVNSTGDAAASTVSVSGSGAGPYNVTLSGLSGNNGTLSVTVKAGSCTDRALNAIGSGAANTSQSCAVDKTGPTVTVRQADGQQDPTRLTPVKFRVDFNEDVTDFTKEDVTVYSGPDSAGGTKTVTVSGSNKAYDVAVFLSGTVTSGQVSVTIPSGAVHDALGNASGTPTYTDNNVWLDLIPPSFYSIQSVPSIAKCGESVHITFTAGEELSADPDVKVNSRPAVFESKTPISGGMFSYAYVYTVQQLDPTGNASISIFGKDLAGNEKTNQTDTTALDIVARPTIGQIVSIDTTGTIQMSWAYNPLTLAFHHADVYYTVPGGTPQRHNVIPIPYASCSDYRLWSMPTGTTVQVVVYETANGTGYASASASINQTVPSLPAWYAQYLTEAQMGGAYAVSY